MEPTSRIVAPAFHVFFAPQNEVDAVSAWLDAVDAWDVSAWHDIRVEETGDGPVIVYEAPRPGFSRHGRTYTRTRPCTVPPPAVTTLPRPDLHDLFREHAPVEFPTLSTDFGCVACTKGLVFVPWRCSTVVAAIEVAAEPAA